MPNRVLPTLICFAAIVSQSFAQDGPTPEQQEMREQMAQMREQVIQRMQEKGIDPMEFAMEMRQRVMDGTFDPAEFQQSLIDRGLIDEQQITRMQTTVQRVTLGSLKQQLKATDEDWQVIEPKLKSVVALRAAAGQLGQLNPMMNMMGMFGGGQVAVSDVTRAMAELRAALKDTEAKAEVIGEKLRAWREARDRARRDLDKAQADLIGVLTVRQEGVLMGLGLIQ
jgi:hypothetical protein